MLYDLYTVCPVERLTLTLCLCAGFISLHPLKQKPHVGPSTF